MKSKLFLLAVFLFLFEESFSQGTWTQKSDFPASGRECPFSFAIGNKGYVGEGQPYYHDFWEYDPVIDAWTQKANFAGPARMAAVSFTINNKGYVCTGGWCCWNNLYNDLWEYDAVANTWTQKANFAGTPRSFAAGFSIGNKGYIGCGYDGTYRNDFWEWDANTNVWSQKSNFPGSRRVEAVGFSINDKGYISTGWDSSMFLNDVWEYDTALNSWTQKANLPAAGRDDASAFSICGKGYLGTGERPLQNDWWQFDPLLNTWTQMANMPGPNRDDCPYFVIGNKGYIGMGDNGSLLTDFWEFTPDSSCAGVPVSSFVPSDTTFCGEGQRCINFSDHSANNPTSWQWLFPGAMPDTSSRQNPANICYNQTGTYSVTLIVANSLGSDTLTISPMVIFSGGPNIPTVTITGDTLISSAASQYLWYFNGAPIAGATDSFFIATSAGTYAVLTSDSLGCSKISTGVLINSVMEINRQATVIIYPNPLTSSSILQFNVNLTDAEVIIYDMVGKVLMRKKLSGDRMKIEKGSLESGVYFLKVSTEERQWVEKLVVE